MLLIKPQLYSETPDLQKKMYFFVESENFPNSSVKIIGKKID